MLKREIIDKNCDGTVYNAMAAGIGLERLLITLMKLEGVYDIQLKDLYI